ncbi:MAG: retropepsin-like aspartic protease [Thermofilaceae archaeon]
MGYLRVQALVGSAEGGPCKELSFLVDTGAFYTVIPPSVAEELGIKPYARTRLTLADKRVVRGGSIPSVHEDPGQRRGAPSGDPGVP